MGTRTVLTVVVRDISERRAIEEEAERRGQALEASERRLRLALQSARMGTWEWDPRSDLLSWDEAQARLWGTPGTSALRMEQAIDRVFEADRAQFGSSLEEALRRGHWEHEFRILLSDGAVRWLGGAGDVLRDPDGKPERLIGVTFDISERRESEEQRQFLTAEMRHRLQNMMSVVQAIVQLSGRGEGEVENYRRSLLERLQSVAQTQRLLMEEKSAAGSLTELLRSELAAYKNADGSNVILEGPPVHVPHDLAAPFGLAVHELATNAAKYGALTVPSGRIEVRWSVMISGGQERLALDWREHGGPEVRTPVRRGFGAKVLERTLGRKAGASVRIDYNPSGLHCAIELPL
jgi:PAS domain S-box-containing protein